MDAIERSDQEINVRPETFTHNKISKIAFTILGKEQKITHIPNWVRAAILRIVRVFTGSKIYRPIEFFMTVMAMNRVSSEYGKHTLKEHFTNLKDSNA